MAPRDHKGFSFGAGTLAEVAIVVTDLAGVVHTYYQDLKAEIDSLPKYGILSTTDTETSSSYANWRNSFDLALAAPNYKVWWFHHPWSVLRCNH